MGVLKNVSKASPWISDPGVGGPAEPVDGPTRPSPWMDRPGPAESVDFRPRGRWPGRACGWTDPARPSPWIADPGVGGPAEPVDGPTRPGRVRGFPIPGSVARPSP